MGEVWVVKKPSRSDEVLAVDEQIKVAQQIRSHFDSLAPKRPTKPNRSDNALHDSTTPSTDSNPDDYLQEPPEFHKLQALRSQSQHMYWENGKLLADDEFIESQYYQELNSIDKQHHTTGKGFIGVAEDGGDRFGYLLQQHGDGGGVKAMGVRSNPATNEWIPSLDGEEALFVSSKPKRSEV